MSQRQDRIDLTLERERCFLVSAIRPGRAGDEDKPLTELAALVDTAGGEVVGRLTQKLERPHPRTYLGQGRFLELAQAVVEAEADTVVIDDDLSPSQLGRLEENCRRKVIDRSEVILDIFASRARTYQAKLQVELAQLEYHLPRLARKWTHLERLGGGIGTRGPGESQIESDRRIIRSKISALKRELAEIEQRKAREVAARSGCFTACLVGYTNAGKSTLMNRLTGADTFVEDRLFATLDTLTRKLELPEGQALLVSDTVGFIRRLPHHLVASFHATLEEAAQADLLLLVLDAASPQVRAQLEAVEDTLTQLGMDRRERLYVLNKIDAASDPQLLESLANELQPSCAVSALTGAGIEELLTELKTRASVRRRPCRLRFSAGDGKRLATINRLGQVSRTEYDNDDVILAVTLEPAELEIIKRLPGRVEVLD